MTIVLKDVTKDNFSAIGALEVSAEQNKFLASNLYSLAEASFYAEHRPRAIYDDDTLVGFLMYSHNRPDDQPEYCDIFRFMIDRRHQGQGAGAQAMARVLEEIQQIESVARITICYLPSNTKARNFYAGFGFEEVDEDEASGEMVAEIQLSRRNS
jgi:diamine N-acetyltransferase